MLKPVDRDRLALTIERLQDRLPAGRVPGVDGAMQGGAGDEAVDAAAGSDGVLAMMLAGGRGFAKVPLADVAWVEAVRNYTRVQVRDRRPWLVGRTMAEWEATLPAPAFGRIRRSLIVNIATISAMQWQSRHQARVFFCRRRRAVAARAGGHDAAEEIAAEMSGRLATLAAPRAVQCAAGGPSRLELCRP